MDKIVKEENFHVQVFSLLEPGLKVGCCAIALILIGQ